MKWETHYGWSVFWFELHDVKFNSGIALEELDEDQEWVFRDPTDMTVDLSEKDEDTKDNEKKIKAWEINPNIRFSKPSRYLNAVAKLPENTADHMYLGVPADKEDVGKRGEEIDGFYFSIKEIEDESLPDTLSKSRMVYREGSEDKTTEVMLNCVVTPSEMDFIEKAITSDKTNFNVAVNLKCWHWDDPIRGTYLYVDKKRPGHAELAEVTATRTFTDQGMQSQDYVYDDPNYRYEKGEVISPDVNVNIYRMLSKIEGHLRNSGRMVVMVIFVGLIALIASKYLS